MQDLRVPDDHREQIVEIVSGASSQRRLPLDLFDRLQARLSGLERFACRA